MDGVSQGSLGFNSTAGCTAKEAIQEFVEDDELFEELEINLKELQWKKIERFSAKFDTFMRIKGSTTLEEYDRLRVTFTHVFGRSVLGLPLDLVLRCKCSLSIPLEGTHTFILSITPHRN